MVNNNLRRENIAAYIIQMYKEEDLIRAFGFDLELIGKHVIHHLPVSNNEKLAQVNHYESLINKMREEGLEKEGHLTKVISIVEDLTKIHEALKISNGDYKKIYHSASPYIRENLKLSEGLIESEVQVCLNGVYGFLLLKLDGKEINGREKEMIDQFGDLLSLLSFKYKEKTVSN